MSRASRTNPGAFETGDVLRADLARAEFAALRASVNRIEDAAGDLGQFAPGAQFRDGQVAHARCAWDETVSLSQLFGMLGPLPSTTAAWFQSSLNNDAAFIEVPFHVSLLGPPTDPAIDTRFTALDAPVYLEGAWWIGPGLEVSDSNGLTVELRGYAIEDPLRLSSHLEGADWRPNVGVDAEFSKTQVIVPEAMNDTPTVKRKMRAGQRHPLVVTRREFDLGSVIVWVLHVPRVPIVLGATVEPRMDYYTANALALRFSAPLQTDPGA